MTETETERKFAVKYHVLFLFLSLLGCSGYGEHPPRVELEKPILAEPRVVARESVVAQVPELAVEPDHGTVVEEATSPALDEPVGPGDTGVVRDSVIFVLNAQAAGSMVDAETSGGFARFVGKNRITVAWNTVPEQTELDALAGSDFLLRLRSSGVEPPTNLEILGAHVDPATGSVLVRFFVVETFEGTQETRVQFWAGNAD